MSGDSPKQEVIPRTAEAVLQFYPELGQYDQLQINASSGVGFGPINFTSSENATHTVDEWRHLVGDLGRGNAAAPL